MNSGRPLSFETSTSFGGHFPAPKKGKKTSVLIGEKKSRSSSSNPIRNSVKVISSSPVV